MNRQLALVLAVLVMSGALIALDYRHGAAPPALSTEREATLAPAMTFDGLYGEQTNLKAYRGRWVLLNVWASWCVPCVTEFPDLLALAEAYPERLQLVTLSVDRTPEAARDFLTRFDAPPANSLHAFDARQRLSRDTLQVYRYPESILIDPGGRMVDRFAGALSKQDVAIIHQRLNADAHGF